MPENHKYFKYMRAIYSNIEEARIKPNTYERFFFNLLLDNPRCSICLAPLENSNEAIKDHIETYHNQIRIQLDRYSYLDVHKYIRELYKFPYVTTEINANQRKTNLICCIPGCGA